jgi:hypothetical protein
MAVPILQPAFSTGEIAPNLFGRADLAREHLGATTLRNMFVSYKGGAYSRPGTMFVGWSAQLGRPFPPRLIPFQFSINQGLILEFGNFYMRVILNGAFVTETPIPITNVTQADPGVVTAGAGSGGSASPINTGVYTSYAPGDTITLAGGTYTAPAVLTVNDTTLLSCLPLARGTGYTPGDMITLAGGSFTTAAVLTIVATQVVSVTLANAGTGGTPGNATVTGTTGTGTKFQAGVTIDNTGVIVSVNSILNPGGYTVNPTVLTNEPVTGGGLVGAELSIVMGVDDHYTLIGGDYNANPAGGVLTQNTTTGMGVGATFQSAIFGPYIVSFSFGGVYTVFPTNPVQQAFSSGGGLGAEFSISWSSFTGNGFNTGDWVYITGVGGMTELDGQTFTIQVLSPTTFALMDNFGNNVDTSVFPAYTGGGTAARIFTLPTIYADADLEYLKFVQSADVMTICCVNQVTGTEYPPQDLARFSDTNWVFTPVVPAPTITAPVDVILHSDPPFGFNYPQYITDLPSVPGANYLYRITAVNSKGEESVASVVFEGQGTGIDCVDVSATAGSITITWDQVPGAAYYNVYKAEPGSTALPGPGTVPMGPIPPSSSLFGFVGTTFATTFVDSNITPDFQKVPPVHHNPFARGQITSVVLDNPGSGYDLAPAVVINSATGIGGVIEADVFLTSGTFAGPPQPAGVAALVLVDGGMDYQQGDTITIVGAGSGATGHIIIGPQSGTYPSVVNYFQERRVFASSLNNPDTYWMSVPGQFNNFDSRIPTIDSDAITGTPWSLQVNGIQFFVLMPAGLATLTGLSAWLLVGAGSFAQNVQPISPKSQVAQPLAFSGCSPTIPPIKINYDIIYVSSKNSYYYDLPYQLYALSEPIDLTILSSHLFDDFALREHAWAESPFKTLWTVRNDGVLLSLTFLKQQQVAGWARHDTNGHFFSVASVVEPVIATPELPTDLPP